MMTRKTFRSTVVAALQAHAWFTTRSITTVDWDGTQADLTSAEAELRAAKKGTVLLVSQVIGAKADTGTTRQGFLTREAQLIVVVRTNPGNSQAVSHDDAVDEVIKAVAAKPVANGASPVLYVEESLIKDDPGLITTHVTFSARIAGVG